MTLESAFILGWKQVKEETKRVTYVTLKGKSQNHKMAVEIGKNEMKKKNEWNEREGKTILGIKFLSALGEPMGLIFDLINGMVSDGFMDGF